MPNYLKSGCNIGVIAPTQTGKTTMMYAMFYEVKHLLSRHGSLTDVTGPVTFEPDSDITQKKLAIAERRYEQIIKSEDCFTNLSNIPSTSDVEYYPFFLKLPKFSISCRFNLMDYPGGALDVHEECSAKIREFLSDSDVLLVPISADLLMEWFRNHKSTSKDAVQRTFAALNGLNIENISVMIRHWCARHRNNRRDGLLIFVPIKCEKYFNDNGGKVNKSVHLNEAVSDLYYSKIKSDLTDTDIRCCTISADTYGFAEVKKTLLITYNGSSYLKSFYGKRENCSTTLSPLGAMFILAEVVRFIVNSQECSSWRNPFLYRKLQRAKKAFNSLKNTSERIYYLRKGNK